MRKTILATTVALSAVPRRDRHDDRRGRRATRAAAARRRRRGAAPPSRADAPVIACTARGHDAGPFALIYRPEDRQLTPADVQKIAEAVLLWNGNRTWKVTEVAEAPDNTVAFAFATQDGSVVARFKMDRKTGRVTRTG